MTLLPLSRLSPVHPCSNCVNTRWRVRWEGWGEHASDVFSSTTFFTFAAIPLLLLLLLLLQNTHRSECGARNQCGFGEYSGGFRGGVEGSCGRCSGTALAAATVGGHRIGGLPIQSNTPKDHLHSGATRHPVVLHLASLLPLGNGDPNVQGAPLGYPKGARDGPGGTEIAARLHPLINSVDRDAPRPHKRRGLLHAATRRGSSGIGRHRVWDLPRVVVGEEREEREGGGVLENRPRSWHNARKSLLLRLPIHQHLLRPATLPPPSRTHLSTAHSLRLCSVCLFTSACPHHRTTRCRPVPKAAR